MTPFLLGGDFSTFVGEEKKLFGKSQSVGSCLVKFGLKNFGGRRLRRRISRKKKIQFGNFQFGRIETVWSKRKSSEQAAAPETGLCELFCASQGTAGERKEGRKVCRICGAVAGEEAAEILHREAREKRLSLSLARSLKRISKGPRSVRHHRIVILSLTQLDAPADSARGGK